MKTKILQIIVLIFLINIVFVRAAIDASYECKEKNCIEGTEIFFTVNVFNNINKSINVGDVYIKDKDYGIVLGFDVSENIIIPPGEVRSFNFTNLVKAPVKGYTFYYVPCFKMSYVNKPEEVFEICGKTVKSFTVLPLSMIECKEDSECEEDEYCNTFSIYKCRKLECNPNESAVNHSCVVLEPKKIVIINWKNVILTAGFIVLLVVLLFLFIGRKQKHEGEDYVDMTTEFSEEKETQKEEVDKKKGEKLDKEYKKIEESSKELKEEKPKKDEENKEIEATQEPKEPEQKKSKKDEEDNHKKEAGLDEEIKKKKFKSRKKGKNNKKKYKRVKQNKVYETVLDYTDKQEEESKKKQEQEIEDTKEDINVNIMDYSGYEDEDENEDKDDLL